ncbi:hypothetical protein [Natronorubrum halophilum]|uniref:hypothetical protein n=1 Tax=Natronorubrum halophilum TaxID=1702106 RepID=UPI001EE9ABC7|nr:hypothetical protein [Natronorubrum halophilum]
MPDTYLDVYESDRPEVFFKATPDRTVGPDEGVGSSGDDVSYDESTSTSKMGRSVEELVGCYVMHNAVPDVSVLLPGASLVPEQGFALHEGDEVGIDPEGVGTLSNTVVEV